MGWSLAIPFGIPAYAGMTVRGRAGRDGVAGNAVVRYRPAGRHCRRSGIGNVRDLTAGALYFFDAGSGPAAELIGNADIAGLINPLQVDVSVGVTVGYELRFDLQVADGKGRVPIAAQNPGLARRQGRPGEVGMDVVIVIPARLDSARVRGVAAGAVAAIPRRRDIHAAGIRSARAGKVGDGKLLILDPPPPPFLPRKLKNAVDADPGNAGFPLGQPALLRRDKAPENAAFPGIDGIVPLVAVFPRLPGFGLAKGIGLVNAAVEGLAPVFGQGFQDGGRPILVGKGLPVGTVPGDGPGLG